MLKSILLMIALAASAAPATAPDWAFPPGGHRAGAQTLDPARTITVPGAARAYPETIVHGGGEAVDWRPGEHGALPGIVARSPTPGGWACGYCHLPGGEGRPENANLAGLPAAYIVRQVEAMKSGARAGVRPDYVPATLMAGVAKSVSPQDLRAAADYFSRQTFTSRVRVVEGAMAPRATPAFFVYKVSKGEFAPLGQRIVEAPADLVGFEKRDGHMTYAAYVPAGAVERGAALARSGGPNAQPCASCHGFGLKGAAGPPIAGRSPSYLFRQLLAFRARTRRAPEAVAMQRVAAGLTDADMIALAAYAAAQKP